MHPDRQIQAWRDTMLTLPDRVFYDLMHNWIGPAALGRQRHTALERLELLVRDQDFATALAGSLDSWDRTILATIHLTGPLPQEGLHPLLEDLLGSGHYSEYHQKILGLMDRLWLVHHPGTGELALSPLCLPLWEGILEEASPKPEHPWRPRTWLSPGFVMALAIHFSQGKHRTRQDRSLAKRGREDFLHAFRGLGDFEVNGSLPEHFPDLCLRAFIALGLVRGDAETDHFTLVPDRLSDLLSMEATDLVCHLAGAAMATEDLGNQRGGLGYHATAVVTRWARRCKVFLELVSPLPGLRPSDARRFWTIASLREGLTDPGDEARRCTEVLVDLGFFAQVDRDGPWLIPTDWAVPGEDLSPPRLMGTGELRCGYQGDPLPLTPLIPILGLERFGLEITYNLDHQAIKQSLGDRRSGAELAVDLERVLGQALPDFLRLNLAQWDEEARSLRATPGWLVQASAIRLVEAAHIMGTGAAIALGHGAWFVPRTEVRLMKALQGLGLPGLDASPEDEAPSASTTADLLPGLRPLGPGAGPSPAARILVDGAARIRTSAGEAPDDPGLEGLMQLLQDLAWSPEEKAEAADRIRRRLVVHESQLAYPPRLSEQGAAQGLDFTGKVRLVEEAVRQRNEYLKIRMLGAAKDQEILVWPRSIKNKGPDAMLHGLTLPSHQETNIYIRKILEVKRIRASLFV